MTGMPKPQKQALVRALKVEKTGNAEVDSLRFVQAYANARLHQVQQPGLSPSEVWERSRIVRAEIDRLAAERA